MFAEVSNSQIICLNILLLDFGNLGLSIIVHSIVTLFFLSFLIQKDHNYVCNLNQGTKSCLVG